VFPILLELPEWEGGERERERESERERERERERARERERERERENVIIAYEITNKLFFLRESLEQGTCIVREDILK
jgi:hypothetical protein